jgi:hypothetical protein
MHKNGLPAGTKHDVSIKPAGPSPAPHTAVGLATAAAFTILAVNQGSEGALFMICAPSCLPRPSVSWSARLGLVPRGGAAFFISSASGISLLEKRVSFQDLPDFKILSLPTFPIYCWLCAYRKTFHFLWYGKKLLHSVAVFYIFQKWIRFSAWRIRQCQY